MKLQNINKLKILDSAFTEGKSGQATPFLTIVKRALSELDVPWVDACCSSASSESFCEKVNACLGISDEGDPDLVLNQQGDWVGAGGSYTFENGITEGAGVVKLGGTLVQDTVIDTTTNYLLRIDAPSNLSTYIGKSGGLNQNWIRKNNTATNLTVCGMVDLSGFAQDSDTIVIGRLDLLGTPTTRIYIQPTTGTITLTALDDVTLSATDDVIITAGDDISINANDAITGGVNTDSGTTAGAYRIDDTKEVISGTPSIVTELKRNQQYAVGFAAYDDPGTEQVANIYYGVLDASNVITDISRVEASDQHAEMIYIYNAGLGQENAIRVNSSGIVFTNSQFAAPVTILNRGYIQATIPSYANDAAADADADLLSGCLYKLNAGRAIYVKP